MRTIPPISERFWSKVDKSGSCWLWTGAKNEHGYGLFNVRKRSKLAHRIAWELAHGEPAADCVLHRCDTPACVRPDHLFHGSKADNSRDMREKGRSRGASLPGEANPWAKLTDAAVLKIRAFAASGMSGLAIARLFSVSTSTACRVINGERWGHVR
jgi:hypothetical protein